MSYVILQVLHEKKPVLFYVLAAALFILSQLAWFLLGRVICKVTLGVFNFTSDTRLLTFFLKIHRALIQKWMVLS